MRPVLLALTFVLLFHCYILDTITTIITTNEKIIWDFDPKTLPFLNGTTSRTHVTVPDVCNTSYIPQRCLECINKLYKSTADTIYDAMGKNRLPKPADQTESIDGKNDDDFKNVVPGEPDACTENSMKIKRLFKKKFNHKQKINFPMETKKPNDNKTQCGNTELEIDATNEKEQETPDFILIEKCSIDQTKETHESAIKEEDILHCLKKMCAKSIKNDKVPIPAETEQSKCKETEKLPTKTPDVQTKKILSYLETNLSTNTDCLDVPEKTPSPPENEAAEKSTTDAKDGNDIATADPSNVQKFKPKSTKEKVETTKQTVTKNTDLIIITKSNPDHRCDKTSHELPASTSSLNAPVKHDDTTLFEWMGNVIRNCTSPKPKPTSRIDQCNMLVEIPSDDPIPINIFDFTRIKSNYIDSNRIDNMTGTKNGSDVKPLNRKKLKQKNLNGTLILDDSASIFRDLY